MSTWLSRYRPDACQSNGSIPPWGWPLGEASWLALCAPHPLALLFARVWWLAGLLLVLFVLLWWFCLGFCFFFFFRDPGQVSTPLDFVASGWFFLCRRSSQHVDQALMRVLFECGLAPRLRW